MSDFRESTVIDDVANDKSAGAVPIDVTTADFDMFYRDHRSRVGTALAFTLGDNQLGFDAVDEAMARAYQRWDDVGGYANPAGWVYRTGLNWARSWLRRRKRSGPKDRLVARPDSGHDRHPDADLAAALAKLSDDQRSVVVLRYFSDWSVAETAAALDIAPGTVKSRLARALEALRTELESPSLHEPATPEHRHHRSER